MKNIIWIIGAVASVILITYVVEAGGVGLFLESPAPERSVLRGCLLAVAMLIGVLAGTLHSKMSSSRQRPWRAFITVWQDRDLWKSLLASPVVFGAVYALLDGAHDPVMAAVFAFQNGFFCNVVLESKRAEVAQPNTKNRM